MSCYFIEYYEISNESKWFLPGITQMEDALERYYILSGNFKKTFIGQLLLQKKVGMEEIKILTVLVLQEFFQMARMWKVMRKVSITVLMEIAGMHLARRFSVSGHSGWI